MRITQIKVTFEATVNTGNYENIKPFYGATAECDIPLEKLEVTFDALAKVVRKQVQEELKAIRE